MAYVDEVRAFDLDCPMCDWKCEIEVKDDAPVPKTGFCPVCLRKKGALIELVRFIPQVYGVEPV